MIQEEGNASDHDWLEIWTVLAGWERSDWSLRMVFVVSGFLCFDDLRLNLEVPSEVRIGELRIGWHIQSLQEVVSLFSNLT